MGTTSIIFRRSINLSKTYLIIGVFMGAMAVGMSALGLITPPSSEMPMDQQTYFSIFFVGMASMTAVLMATPVLLLFVYDKNNGVLEYMLSIGMTQSSLFRSYLQAALALAGIILTAEVTGNAALTLILGGSPENPSRMFIFDLGGMKWPELFPSFFERHEVDPKKPITMADLGFLFR